MKQSDSASGQTIARLLRPQNARLGALFYIALSVGVLNAGQIVGGVLLLVLGYGWAAVVNDLGDVAIDRSNKRDLPLAKGRLGTRQVMQVLIIVTLAYWLVALGQPQWVRLLTFGYLLAGWLYSRPPFKLSHRGLWGSAVLAYAYAVIPFWLHVLQAGRSLLEEQTLGLSFALLIGAMSYLLYKDHKDEAGDRLHGKRTPLVWYGDRAIRRLSLGFAAISIAVFVWLASLAWWSVGLGSLALYINTLQYRRKQPSIALLQGFAGTMLLLAVLIWRL